MKTEYALEEIDESFIISSVKNRFLEKLNNIGEEVKLRNVTRKKQIRQIDQNQSQKINKNYACMKNLKLVKYYQAYILKNKYTR